MPRNVFITGVTGFIGSAVASRFANAGYNVYGLVRNESKAKELIGKEISPIFG
jgi:nucleoside-diphosphate-sugar epimerase